MNNENRINRPLEILRYNRMINNRTTLKKGLKTYRVLCCAICRTDAKMWEQGHRDLVLPRVLGHEMVVEKFSRAKIHRVARKKVAGTASIVFPAVKNLCEDMKNHRLSLGRRVFPSRVALPEESLIPIPVDLDVHAACFAEPVGCVINGFEKLALTGNEKNIDIRCRHHGINNSIICPAVGACPPGD